MGNGSVDARVTRREFYMALAVVWLYIMAILGRMAEADAKWTTRLLCILSLVISIMYAVMAFRSRSAQGERDKAA